MDYKNAGVDIEAGYESVELMKKFVKGTMRPEVLGGLGGFSGAFSLGRLMAFAGAASRLSPESAILRGLFHYRTSCIPRQCLTPILRAFPRGKTSEASCKRWLNSSIRLRTLRMN